MGRGVPKAVYAVMRMPFDWQYSTSSFCARYGCSLVTDAAVLGTTAW